MARRAPRLAFVRAFSDTNIWRIDLQSAKPVPARVIASSRGEFQADQASQDGRIVFRSSRTGTPQIWIAGPDGGNPEQLTTNAVLPAAPRLSPDGKWVVFAARPEGNVDLYLVESSGGSIRRLTTEPGEDHSARFSRDGQWIYFCSNRLGRRDIWKLPSDGSGPARQVTRNGGWVSRESADGQWLFYSKDNVSPSLFRMPSGGGPEEIVVPRSAYSQWDVGERGIYFVEEKEIRFFRFADRKTESILKIPLIGGSDTGLALSADGRFLIYTQIDSRVSDIMLLDNFRGY